MSYICILINIFLCFDVGLNKKDILINFICKVHLDAFVCVNLGEMYFTK